MAGKLSDHEREFLSLAATRIAFDGARIQGRRLVPDDDHVLEQGPDKQTLMLRPRAPGGTGVTITCDCALEGGGCTPIIVEPGSPDEYGACVPDSGCGSTGLFCFMDFGFAGGLRLRIAM